MSWELLYKRFLVKEPNGSLTPYIITGSNNAFEMSGKRERSVYDFYKYYPKKPKESLREFLGRMYDIMAREDSGYLKGVSKTKKGFIEGFYKKTITRDEFIPYGVRMENYLKNKFKSTVKKKSDYEIGQGLTSKPLIPVNNENMEKYLGVTVFPHNRHGEAIMGRGKFKRVRDGEYGFFKSKSKRRYYYPSNMDFFKVVK